jgi:TRAP-type mannitol/chloroaromatic compound transport system permease small subunit
MPGLVRIINLIDGFTNAFGSALSWLVAPLVAAVTYEVVARYAFDAPTIWAFDTTYMLYGAIFMLGAAYTLLKGAHIRTDMLWENYSDRTKGLIDLIAYVAFFFPGLMMIFITSVDDAFYSFQIGERGEQTAFRPIMWPFKAVVPLTAALLMIQGVSELLKSIIAVRTGRLFARAEKIEV